MDISVKTRFSEAMYNEIKTSPAPAGQYIAKYTHEFYYLWDELEAAALIDPKIITKERTLYVDVDTTRGPNYGDTLTWTAANKPQFDLTPETEDPSNKLLDVEPRSAAHTSGSRQWVWICRL